MAIIGLILRRAVSHTCGLLAHCWRYADASVISHCLSATPLKHVLPLLLMAVIILALFIMLNFHFQHTRAHGYI